MIGDIVGCREGAACITHGDGQEEKDNNNENLKKRVEGADAHNTGVAPIAHYPHYCRIAHSLSLRLT